MTRYLVKLAEMETSSGVRRYNDLLAMVYHVLGYQWDFLVCDLHMVHPECFLGLKCFVTIGTAV